MKVNFVYVLRFLIYDTFLNFKQGFQRVRFLGLWLKSLLVCCKSQINIEV